MSMNKNKRPRLYANTLMTIKGVELVELLQVHLDITKTAVHEWGVRELAARHGLIPRNEVDPITIDGKRCFFRD
jgi:sporulation protein YlmC with PRC-barrel domain